jgi:hypothetical protein
MIVHHFNAMRQAFIEIPGAYVSVYVEDTRWPSVYMGNRDGRYSRIDMSLWGPIAVFRRRPPEEAMHDMQIMAENGSTFTHYFWGNP